MKLLLHSCCAPCTIFPFEQLLKEFSSIEVLFYNPNIHPYREYKSRKNCLSAWLDKKGVKLHLPADYELETFFQRIVFNENVRCQLCYELRLDFTFNYAKENGFDAVTTTLLYSKYQNHSLLITLGEKLSTKYDIPLFYQDFREGWQYGIDKSIKEDMYRQTYCGCLYSEQERYDNKFKKKQRKLKKALNKDGMQEKNK